MSIDTGIRPVTAQRPSPADQAPQWSKEPSYLRYAPRRPWLRAEWHVSADHTALALHWSRRPL